MKSLLLLALGCFSTVLATGHPTIEQQLQAGVAIPFDPMTLKFVKNASSLAIADIIKEPTAPASQPAAGLKQATRSDIIARERRREKIGSGKRQLQSGQPFTCVPDTTPSVSGVRAAVFQRVSTGDNGDILATQPTTDFAGCTRFCYATTGCTFSYDYSGICYANDASNFGVMGVFNEDDSFYYINTDCAAHKVLVPSSANFACCNLYYN